MKWIGLTLLLLFVQFAKAQYINNFNAADKGNIYYQSLAYYTRYLKSEKNPGDTLFVEDDFPITDSLMNDCNGMTIVKIRKEDLWGYLQQRKGIVLCRIMPVNFKDGYFVVRIVPSSCSFDKRIKKVKIGTGGEFLLRYSFDGSVFHFESSELHGI